jgi:ADP-ribose pyrophosphatase
VSSSSEDPAGGSPGAAGPDQRRTGEGDRVLAAGRYLRLVVRRGWEFADRAGITGIVGIIALTPAGSLVLVEQERPPVNGTVIELPAGLVGDEEGSAGEDLLTGAARELREETGYEADRWSIVAAGPASPGTTSEVITLLLATGLRKVAAGGGAGEERLTVHEAPLDDIEEWLAAQERRGAQVDLKVHAGICFARRALSRTAPTSA